MAKASTQARIDLVSARETLTKLHDGLRSLVSQITEDHKKLQMCSNYPQFQKLLPTAHLENAGNRLQKKEYKVAFVGPFKAGKSTFLSALLQQPGMLPAEDAECTFAVSLIAAPPPGSPEQLKITYYTAEEALRNILGTIMRYDELFRPSQKAREEILREFSADRARDFIGDCAEKNSSGAKSEEAAEVKDFLNAFKTHRERLGKTHVDTIEHLSTYVRKEEGIGHLLLIKLVEIFRNNPVISKQNFQIADTPGTDSMNQAARNITLTYLKEADAVIYLAEARGLSTNFEVIRKQLTEYHNDIREKMFIVANKADGYENKSMIKDGKKAPIEVVFEGIVTPLRALNINEEKLYFTCGRLSELNQKIENGTITSAERETHSSMRKALEDKLHLLDPGINPVLHRLLTTCFTDGGVDAFRRDLVDYLAYDIQVERLKEVYIDLDRAHTALSQLLEPEQLRVKRMLEELGPINQQITTFFTDTKNRFLDKVSVIDSNAGKAVTALMGKAREQIERMIDNSVERLNIGRVKQRVSPPNPRNIKMEVINLFKTDLSEKFIKIIQDTIAPVIQAKLTEQVAESRVSEILGVISKSWGGDFDDQFQQLMDNFNVGLDRFTLMRSREETWALLAASMEPTSHEMEWTEKVETAFRADLKKVFVSRFVDYCTKLDPILARHYQGLINDLFRDLEKMLDSVSEAIKKDPSRVMLPANLLTGGSEESEDDKKRAALMSYFKSYEDIRKLHEKMVPSFGHAVPKN